MAKSCAATIVPDRTIFLRHATFVSFSVRVDVCHLLLFNKTFGIYDDCDYDKFWLSGGSTGFRNGYSDSYIKKGDWYVDEHRLPIELRAFATLLINLFNDNVPKGCCGGCL